MNNEKLSDEIRTLLENAKKWQQLLFDSEYVTTGRIIGRVTRDSGDFSDIKEINFENSAGTQILELLKKTYSSENLINSHLIRLGFVCIDNRICKVDSLACEGCKIGRIGAVSILEDGPEKKRLYVPEEHVDSTHEESLEEYIENIGYRYLEVIKDKNSNWIISWQETYEFDPAKILVFK